MWLTPNKIVTKDVRTAPSNIASKDLGILWERSLHQKRFVLEFNCTIYRLVPASITT